MLHLFGFFGTRRASNRTSSEPRRFRPTLESLEARDVPSASAVAAPALGPALVSTASPIQQATSLLPVNVNSVNITGLSNGALQLVAHATTPNGQSVPIPLTLTNDPASTATNPILDLHLGPINLNLLGLNVQTSEICLKITATPGPGNLLGNLLSDVSNLLNDPSQTLGGLLGSLTSGQLTTLTSGLGSLVNGALGAAGSTTNAATGGASVTSTGTTQILHLSLGPVNLNLLGLGVDLDNCAGGPITVDITAQSGPGNLLGNLLGGLSHLLDSNANTTALLNKVDKIAGEIASIL